MLCVNLEKLQELDYKSNEAYKSLRANIQFCGNDIKLICFTSCLPNEGKSMVSFNLAISLAQSGKKVIFLDGDLRRSIMVGRYKPDQAVTGLTHYLSGQSYMEEIIYETNIENLSIIFTGPVPPNPAELLSSMLFTELLGELRKDYDYVIIDTPPLGRVIDSAIIAKHCDGVVLIIEANAIRYKLAQKVKNQLQRGNIRILGAILNKVESNSMNYRYYGRKYKKYDKDYYFK